MAEDKKKLPTTDLRPIGTPKKDKAPESAGPHEHMVAWSHHNGPGGNQSFASEEEAHKFIQGNSGKWKSHGLYKLVPTQNEGIKEAKDVKK